MLMAAFNVAEELGIHPGVIRLEGTDIDELCVRMALLQLAAVGADATLNWGDSLTDETRAVWRTLAASLRINGKYALFNNFVSVNSVIQKTKKIYG